MRSLATAIILLVLPLVGARAQERESVLEGRVLWRGRPPAAREVLWPPGSRGHDVRLENLLVGRRLRDESLRIDPETGGIADVLVRLPDYRLPRRRDATAAEIVIEKLACRPLVLPLPRGVPLFVRNADPIAQVLRLRCDAGEERSVALAPGARVEIELPDAEVIDLVAERFAFVRARVHRIGDEPALVTGADGSFAIRGLKGRELKLEFEHPLLGRGSRLVSLEDGAGTGIEIDQRDFAAPPSRDGKSPFDGRDDPVFRIEGLVVPRRDFEAVVAFLAARHQRFGLPRAILEAHALRHVLVPLAATFARHRDEVSGLEARGAAFEAALERGASFAEVARSMTGAEGGADFGPVARGDLEPWIGRQIFATPRRIPTGPVWSPRGLHYFLVTEVTGEGAEERRSGHQVFFAWRRDRDPAEERVFTEALARRARIEALDPRLEGLVPTEEDR